MPQDEKSTGARVSGFLALGGNEAGPHGTVRETQVKALEMLGELDVDVTGVSRFFETPAHPLGSGPDFCNSVASYNCYVGSEELRAICHRVEAALGRIRQGRWGARAIDIDILCYGDLVSPDTDTWQRWVGLPPARQRIDAPNQLILPHPRLQDRGFVLVPWADLAPDWRHPVTGLSVAEMRDALPAAEVASIAPLDPVPLHPGRDASM